MLNQKLPFNKLVGAFGCIYTTVLQCCWILKSGTKIVNTRVNRFTRVLQFSRNNYFFLKNRKFVQKREKGRFSAGVSGLARRPGLCRSASYGESAFFSPAIFYIDGWDGMGWDGQLLYNYS